MNTAHPSVSDLLPQIGCQHQPAVDIGRPMGAKWCKSDAGDSTCDPVVSPLPLTLTARLRTPICCSKGSWPNVSPCSGGDQRLPVLSLLFSSLRTVLHCISHCVASAENIGKPAKERQNVTTPASDHFTFDWIKCILVKEHRRNHSGAVLTPQFKPFRPVSPSNGYANSSDKCTTLPMTVCPLQPELLARRRAS
jgi:hypothetical protein